MGGGFGIVYKDEKPFTPIQFENLIVPYLTEMKCGLIVEPGRLSWEIPAFCSQKLSISSKPAKRSFTFATPG